MDPVTHALAGAAAARVAVTRPLGNRAWLPGALGAWLPDADALIRSSADPLLYAEFHRHFTHSLAFIPIGGVIAALPWLLQPRHRPRWKAYLAAATSGYATHGVLDAATTWGTRLLWPVSDARLAWNWISIVDPLFTTILMIGVMVSIGRRSAGPAVVALALGAMYLAAGALLHSRAREVQARVAASRGHVITRGAVMPGFASNVVWRSLYEADGVLHVDRVRIPWWGAPTWAPGYAMPAFGEHDLPAAVSADARVRRDVRRFARFAGGWMARVPGDAFFIGDGRYSSAEHQYEPVWGIRVRPDGTNAPVEWVDRSRERRIDRAAWWRELTGRDPRHRPSR